MITFKVDDIKKMNACLKPFLDYLRNEDVTDDDVFDSRLVSCELIANVIKHLGEEAEFSGTLNQDSIIITVSSASTDCKKLSPSLPDVFAESGRGLYIIKTLCSGISSDGCSIKVIIRRRGHEKQ